MLTVKKLWLYIRIFTKSQPPPDVRDAGEKTLEWADVFPFLYIQAAFEGLKKSPITKHLVIDEMRIIPHPVHSDQYAVYVPQDDTG